MIVPVPIRTESEEQQTISRLQSIVVELLLKNGQLRQHAFKLSNHAKSNVVTGEGLQPRNRSCHSGSINKLRK